MQYTTLPTTDVKISRICLGTMTWGRQNSRDDAFAQMDYALDQGVNFWDTAELYAVPTTPETQGLTEEYIGDWFEQTGRRDKVVLATKVVGTGIQWIRDGSAIDGAGIKEAVEGSLKRLKTDYIDLYQLHWPNRGHYHFRKLWTYNPYGHDNLETVTAHMLEVLETLDGLMKAGKIRHVGLSNETAWGVMHFARLARAHDLPRMVTIQNEYNLMYRQYDTDLSETSYYEEIGLLAYSPLASGILTGKYQNGAIPEGSRGALTEGLWGRINDKSLAATAAYLEVARKHGLDPAQMAIAFTLARPFTTASIIGATGMKQLETNIAAGDISLSQAALDDITAVFQDYPMPF